MPRIACLHTAASNAPVFDAALRHLGAAGVELRHSVHADLLEAAERAGGLTAAIARRTSEVLRGMQDEADAVLLTCSTLGPAADSAAASLPPILRVDAALAREAVRDGGTVVVLCAAETTLGPTRLLFESAARTTGAMIVMRLVPGAWDVFRAGDRDRYLAMIARAADAAGRDGATQVALAQASMAGAVPLASAARPPLGSPAAGLVAAIEAARRIAGPSNRRRCEKRSDEAIQGRRRHARRPCIATPQERLAMTGRSMMPLM